MRLLDLCSGAGGCAEGYHRAGFDSIVGVDAEPQPRYPFEFVQADAVEFLMLLTDPGEAYGWSVNGFSAIHVSPPCQRWTRSRSRDSHPDLIAPLRPLLETIGLPYVIENVPAAPLRSPTILCGSSFGLRVRRHRAFETSFPLMGVPCAHDSQAGFVTVAGGGPNPASFRRGPNATGGPDRKPKNVADAQDAMGIDWMTRRELNEAIPPAFTEYIGTALIEEVSR